MADPFAGSKLGLVIGHILTLPDNTFEQKRQFYLAGIDREYELISRDSDDWKAIMGMRGLLNGGVAKFEREFPMHLLPNVKKTVAA